MIIQFDTEKEIVAVPESRITLTGINIIQLVDNPNTKQVRAFTEEVGILTLWEGDAYDTIGQWTDADVAARINELYS